MNHPHLYTNAEAAHLLGVSESTLQSQTTKGRIKADKDGLYHVNEIVRYRRQSQPEQRALTGGDFYLLRDGKNATPYTGTSFGGIDEAAAAKEPESTAAIGDAAETVSGEPA